MLQQRKRFHQRIIHVDKKTYVVPDDMTDQEIIQKIEKDNWYIEFQRPAGEPIQILNLPSDAKLDDPKLGEIWEEQSRSHEQVRSGEWYSVAAPVAWPILGFLIPWGALKGIRWVLAGLIERHSGCTRSSECAALRPPLRKRKERARRQFMLRGGAPLAGSAHASSTATHCFGLLVDRFIPKPFVSLPPPVRAEFRLGPIFNSKVGLGAAKAFSSEWMFRDLNFRRRLHQAYWGEWISLRRSCGDDRSAPFYFRRHHLWLRLPD
jgi:hypothetical protein